MVGQYYQSALNRYQLHHLYDLKTVAEEMPSSTEEEKDLKAAAKTEHTLYALEAFTDGYSPVKVPLHKKIKNASYCMQCKSPAEFEGSGRTHINCALGKC